MITSIVLAYFSFSARDLCCCFEAFCVYWPVLLFLRADSSVRSVKFYLRITRSLTFPHVRSHRTYFCKVSERARVKTCWLSLVFE